MFWDLAAQAQAQAARAQAPPAPTPAPAPPSFSQHGLLQGPSSAPDLSQILAQQAQATQQAQYQAQLQQAQLQQAQQAQYQAQLQQAQYQAQLQQHAQAQAQAQLQAQIAAQQAQAQAEAEAKRQANAQAQANALLQAQLAAQNHHTQAAQVQAQLQQARLNALAQASRPLSSFPTAHAQAGPMGLSIGQRPQWPSFRPSAPNVVRPPGGGMNRPLTREQKEIRDGDFQVRQAAGQRAAEQVQEALDNATFAQKRLAEATQKAEDCLEKAQQSQQYQLKSRSPDVAGAGGLNFQQQQVWMQTVSNELFNEAGGIGDQILAMAESAIDATRRAAQKVNSAADPLLGLAKKAEHVTRVQKAQQLGHQADAMAQSSQASVGASRERLQAARDERDVSALLAACQAMKASVSQASLGAGSVFQASQLAQHAAPAVSTGGGAQALQGKTTSALPGPVRELLPIDDHQDEIVRTINERRVTCIQGETGCGKSSRVPQYAYFFCRKKEKRGSERIIVCTQPRRLAALTLAQRVANEMGESTVGGLVGYRMSGDSAVDRSRTKLLFVTTGYLLQVLVNDPSNVRNYSHIILDEAHERSVDADLLSLVLKLQVQHKMADFKIIIMSATLQGGIFSRYFQDEGEERSPPPPIFVGVKRFNLDMMYLDDLAGLCSIVAKGDVAASTLDELRQHTGLSLTKTGQEALNSGMDGFRHVIQKLQMRTQASNLAAAQAGSLAHLMGAAGMPGEAETEFWRINADPSVTGDPGNAKSNIFVKPQIHKGFEHLALEIVRILGCGGEGILIFLPGIGEISEFYDVLETLEHPLEEQQLAGITQQRRSPCEYKIFVLHSTIPMDEQEQAFHQPPDNVCHVFLASTIAESSVTLPKVRVVIDFSLRRQMAHDRTRHGLQCLLTQWVSHASASQRSGRAGRVFPGVSIRMVPRAFYNQVMPQYDPPEIEQAPLEKLYLNVKQLSHRIREKMPRIGALPPRQLLQLTVQPPPTERLEEAVHTLAELGALTTRSDETAQITVLGRMAIALPLDLRLCRLVLFGVLFGCAADAIVMAAALSGQDPFTLPISMVIKDHWKFARAMMRSSEARRHFDKGSLSEPIMLRNLFLEWLQGLQPGDGPDAPRFLQSGSTQRYVFVKRATEFSQQYAVMPKRLTQMALAVVDVAQRTLDFLEPATADAKESPARTRLESLLAHLGVQPTSKSNAAGPDKSKTEESAGEKDSAKKKEDSTSKGGEKADGKDAAKDTKDAKKDEEMSKKDTPSGADAKTPTSAAANTTMLPIHDLFAEDTLLLKAAITAAFSPLYAHGVVRCVEYTSKIGGPQLALKASAAGDEIKSTKQANPVLIPAESQVAKLCTQMIHDPHDLLGGPRHSFCVPHVAEIFLQHPDTWAHSLRDFTSVGNAKFKKLQILDHQAFFTFEGGTAADDVVSEIDTEEEICPPESLMAQAAEEPESSGDEYVRQRAESSESESGEGGKKAKRKRGKKRASGDQDDEGDTSKRTRKEDEEESEADQPSEAAGGERGKIQVKWKTTRTKLNAGEVAEEPQQEGDEAAEEKDGKQKQSKKEKPSKKEKDKEKEDKAGEAAKGKAKEKKKEKEKGKGKEKEKEKSKKGKEKEKDKRSRSRSKKRRVDRSKSRDSSRSRSKDKKKSSTAKDRKRDTSKDRKEAAKRALEGLDAAEAVAGKDAAALYEELQLESAEVSIEDAFEGMTEEQREKQRRRLERFRAMQDPQQSADSDASKPKKMEVKIATGGGEQASVLAKLQARAEEEATLGQKVVYKVGDKIEVKLMPDEGGNEQWHPAEVIGHNDDGTMNITWEQDGTEDCCAPDEARHREGTDADSEVDDDRPQKKHKGNQQEADPNKLKAVEQARAGIEEKRKLLAEKDATLMELLSGVKRNAPTLTEADRIYVKKPKPKNEPKVEKDTPSKGKQAKSDKAKEEAKEEDDEDELLKQLKASAANATMDASFAEFMSEVTEMFKDGGKEKPQQDKDGSKEKPKQNKEKPKEDKDTRKKSASEKQQASNVEVVDLDSDDDTKKKAGEGRKKKADASKKKQDEKQQVEQIDLSSDEADETQDAKSKQQKREEKKAKLLALEDDQKKTQAKLLALLDNTGKEDDKEDEEVSKSKNDKEDEMSQNKDEDEDKDEEKSKSDGEEADEKSNEDTEEKEGKKLEKESEKKESEEKESEKKASEEKDSEEKESEEKENEKESEEKENDEEETKEKGEDQAEEEQESMEKEKKSQEKEKDDDKDSDEDEKSKADDDGKDSNQEDEKSKDEEEDEKSKEEAEEEDKSESEKDKDEKDSDEEGKSKKDEDDDDDDDDEKDSDKEGEKSDDADSSKKSDKEDEKSTAGDEDEQKKEDEKPTSEKDAKATSEEDAKATEDKEKKAIEEKEEKATEEKGEEASKEKDEKASKGKDEKANKEKDDKEKDEKEEGAKEKDEKVKDKKEKDEELKDVKEKDAKDHDKEKEKETVATAKEEAKEKVSKAKEKAKEEDDDFADFLNEIQSLDNSEEAAKNPEEPSKKAEPSDTGKDSDAKKAMPDNEGQAAEEKKGSSDKTSDAPDAAKDTDFMDFLNELEDLEKAPQPPEPEPEEDAGEDLYRLPEVELKRRIRALGATIPPGMHRKDELVELLQEAEAPKQGDDMANFLGELGNLGEGDQKNPDAAFEAFMTEIDQMPGAGDAAGAAEDGNSAKAGINASVKGSKPLTLSFVPERNAWVVSVGNGFGERAFQVQGPGGPVQARRSAVQYCKQKLKDLESGDLLSTSVEKTRDELQRLVDKAKASEDAAEGKEVAELAEQVCRGLEFHAMHLLHQVAGGKGTFLWPFRQRQQFAGNKGMKEYTAEVEQKFEVSRPAHPFQLSWRVCLDRTSSGSASFGTGNFRNPTGLVISCPSKSRVEQLRVQYKKQEQDNAELQKRLKQEHEKVLAAAMAAATTPEAAAEAAQKAAAQVYSSATAAAAESARSKDTNTGWARRLERFAVFCGAQGREDRTGNLQLEGLTVLNNEDGSNALPVLMMLAFMRPRVCGGAVAGGCSVLCDLDTMRVRAVSMFGHSAETRWILPLTGKRRLMLEDLKHVNAVRNAISAAFAVVDDEDPAAEPTAAQSGSGREPCIREDPEIGRALGMLLAEVGKGPSPFELEDEAQDSDNDGATLPPLAAQAAPPLPVATPGSAVAATAATASKDATPEVAPAEATDTTAQNSKPKRELGDVWIDLEEEGGGFDDVDPASFVRWDAPMPKSAVPKSKPKDSDFLGGFFSFDAPVDKFSQEAAEEEAKRKAEAEAAAAEAAAAEERAKAEAEAAAARELAKNSEPKRFAFLPELGLPKAFADRVESFRSMQVEAKNMVTEGKQAMKVAEQLVRTMKDTARKVDSTMESARHAWNMAMHANNPPEAHKAMDRAVRTMQEVGVTMSMLSDMAKEIEQIKSVADERETRAASCNETAPHIWNSAAKKAKVHKGKLNFQWNLTSNALQRAEVSKRTAMYKADDTVRLVNDKLRRWEDERLILLEEAQIAEQMHQQEVHRQNIAVLEAQRQAQMEMQRQQQEQARQQMEMERQRMNAIQWGRNMVQPIENMQFLERGMQSSSSAAADPSEETAPPPPPDDGFAGASEPPPPGPPEEMAPGPPPPPEDGVTAPPPPPDDDGTPGAPPPGPPQDAPPGSAPAAAAVPPAGWLFGGPSHTPGQRW